MFAASSSSRGQRLIFMLVSCFHSMLKKSDRGILVEVSHCPIEQNTAYKESLIFIVSTDYVSSMISAVVSSSEKHYRDIRE
jgi:hypothetical protein